MTASKLVGTVISGRYRIDELIAESETGALYKGEHAHMRKRIAVKVLPPNAAARPDLLARFEREAIAGAHVDHPNVAAAKDFGVLEDGSSFFVIEYLDGKTLRAAIAEGPLPPARAITIAAQIARALDAAHTKGIVHRALSPDTVHLVERGGQRDVVKVVDFGLAMLPQNLIADAATAPGRAQRIATPIAASAIPSAYASPEFLDGNPVDGRADLFGLGVMIYEMVAGAPPARGAPPPSLVSRGAPADLDVLLQRLLAADPAHRSVSALEIAESLDALTSPVLAQPPPSIPATQRSGAERAAPPASGFSIRAREGTPPANLPASIQLALSGGAAIIVIVLLAIAVRAPIQDDDQEAPIHAKRSAPTATTAPEPDAPSVAPGAIEAPITESSPRDLRARFFKDVQVGRMRDAIATLDRLLEADPASAEDHEIRTALVDQLSQRIMLLDDDTPDKMFDSIATKMGTAGADILYELLTTKGGSRAAKRADEVLRDPTVRERGTPAMQIAYDLRTARKCDDRIALFDRAKTDADGRTLGQLQLLNRDCSRRDECCLHNDPRLREAIDAIKQRLR